MPRRRIRLRFSKRGDLRFIGHRDLLRTLERLFRRAGLKLAMSQGFHPKPRLSFASALAVGIHGLDEVMELELADDRTGEEVLAAIRPHCLEGLDFHTAELLPEGTRSTPVESVCYRIAIPPERCAALAERIELLRQESTHPIRRPDRTEPIDLVPHLEEAFLEASELCITLRVLPGANVRPREVLAALGLDDLEQQGFCLTRTEVHLKHQANSGTCNEARNADQRGAAGRVPDRHH